MATNGVLPNGISYGEHREDSPPDNATAAPAVRPPVTLGDLTSHDTLALGGFANGAFRNHSLSNGVMIDGVVHDLRDFRSRISSRSSQPSPETGPTSFDSTFVDRIEPNPLRAPPNTRSGSSPNTRAGSRASRYSRVYAGPSSPSQLFPTRVVRNPLPAIAALKVDAFTFTVFGRHPKFGVSAYAIFDVTALRQNPFLDGQRSVFPPMPPPPYRLTNDYPGNLIDLEIESFISGAGLKLAEIGSSKIETLYVEDHWVIVVHVGVKENSLASRLSTSVRSRQSTTPRQSEDKYSSFSLIDQWLDVLKMEKKKKNEPVIVTAVVRYRHCFLPDDALVETRASCTIKMQPESSLDSALEAARQGPAPHTDAATIGSEFSNSTEDLLRHATMGSSIVRALDPGHNSVRLTTVERKNGQVYSDIRGSDALRLIEDFRAAWGFAAEHYCAYDLAALEAYYRQAHARESPPTETPTLARSLRRRAKSMVSKLSPQKLLQKSAFNSVLPVPARPATPMSPHAEMRPRSATNTPGVRSTVVNDEGSPSIYARVIESYAGEPSDGVM